MFDKITKKVPKSSNGLNSENHKSRLCARRMGLYRNPDKILRRQLACNICTRQYIRYLQQLVEVSLCDIVKHS